MRMAMRMIVPAAAAAMLAAAAPALARGDGEDNALRDRETSRIIIVTDKDRGRHIEAQGEAGGRVHVYSLDRDALIACGDDRRVIERSSPDGHDRTKVVLCTRGAELSAEDRSVRLEHVLERIQHMDGLSDSSKERVTAALRGAIEELRNTH
jgi:hypothetical protein